MFAFIRQIKFQLPFILLLAAMLPLLGFSLFSLQLVRSDHLATQNRANLRTASQAAALIEQSIDLQLKNLTVTADNLALSDLSAQDAEWVLLTILKQHKEIRSLTLLTAQKKEQVRVAVDQIYTDQMLHDRAQDAQLAKIERGQPFVTAPIFNDGIGYTFKMVLPLFDPVDRQLAAILEAELLTETILSSASQTRIGQKSFLSVIDTRGQIIAHPDPSVILSQSHFIPPAPKVQGEYNIYNNLNGIEVIGAQATVPRTGWQVLAERPLAETMGTITAIEHSLLWVLGAILALCLPLTYAFSRRMTKPLQKLEQGAKDISSGKFDTRLKVHGKHELSRVMHTFNTMAQDLQQYDQQRQHDGWINDRLSKLDNAMRGVGILEQLGNNALETICRQGEMVAARLLVRTKDTWHHAASYCLESAGEALTENSNLALVDQAARSEQNIEVNGLSQTSLVIRTGFAEVIPDTLIALPLQFDQQVVAVLELASLSPLSDLQRVFLRKLSTPLATAVHSCLSRTKLETALHNAQELTDRLTTQQEELRVSNEELAQQTQQLRSSEEELRVQQEELQTTNEELEEKSNALEEQQQLQLKKNTALEAAQKELEDKAIELEKASRYKSEFLANMSHELRTPLNSLLILAQELAENKNNHLSAKETTAAEVIFSSGKDLLQLINEILDLSKIEAGRMEIHPQPVFITDMEHRLSNKFRHMAENKHIEFTIKCDADVPEQINSDAQRLDQILNNLLSNAIKFTEHGSVRLHFYRPITDELAKLQQGEVSVAIAVTDTGIGIPEQHIEDIFGVFHQVDGSISRRYGGTGLGLSITRAMCKLLGAHLHVASTLGKGSTFTLYMPVSTNQPVTEKAATVIASRASSVSEQPTEKTVAAPASVAVIVADKLPAASIADDRQNLKTDDQIILIVEDDLRFAQILADLCKKRQLSFLHAGDGETALELIKEFPHISAILLDMRLPGLHGMEVLETVKNNRELRHIPVHVITATEDTPEALQRGALSLLHKPVSSAQLEEVFNQIETMRQQPLRQLLIVEGEQVKQQEIRQSLAGDDVEIFTVASGSAALQRLREQNVDGMILDVNLPDMSALELLQQIDSQEEITVPPIILYAPEPLSAEENTQLQHYTRSIIIQQDNHAAEHLIDETSLFLHRVVKDMPDQQQKIIDALHQSENIFQDKTILVVDDDMRNVFALSHVLEQRDINVLQAANGQKALDLLEEHPEIDLVLMDIMMPIMDGYQAMQQIRKQERWKKLPILALTAKAMPEDRQRCLDAGANDYLTKPVHMQRLLSLLRIWLYR
jgi:CheY-like chemotaxis protein